MTTTATITGAARNRYGLRRPSRDTVWSLSQPKAITSTLRAAKLTDWIVPWMFSPTPRSSRRRDISGEITCRATDHPTVARPIRATFRAISRRSARNAARAAGSVRRGSAAERLNSGTGPAGCGEA